MKKLLILAAVIVAGVAANAALFKWTGATIYGSDSTTKFTGTVGIYAYLSTATAADAIKVVDAFVVAGTMKSDAAGTANGFTYNWTDVNVGDTYNFYLVFEDGGKIFDSSVSTPSVVKSGVAYVSQTATVAFSNMGTSTQATGNWSAVPEPTSGLLMLLGMAGLALCRRRA